MRALPLSDPTLHRIDPDLAATLMASGLTPLRLRDATLLPLVQGGMGVGISAHSLAGSVAAQGGVGTISSVDLRRLHPDLMKRTLGLRGEVAKMLGQFCTDEEITTEGRCEVQVGTQIQIVKLRWKLGPSDHVVREMWDNADRRSHGSDRRHRVARRLAVNRV